jgi:bifunctional NMN adenylyltransferase/nudix hydrolase
MKKYDAIVFIGRFQPFHNAHLEIVKRAYELTDNLIMIIGSQYKPVTYKNPFQISLEHLTTNSYWSALRQTILGSVNVESEMEKDLEIEIQEDIYGDAKWCDAVQEKVKYCAETLESPNKIGIIGCDKDETSYYLKMFPQWELIEVPLEQNLSATQIRELYFVEEPNMNFVKSVVPEEVFNYLNDMKSSEWHNHIVNERRFIETYKSQYASLPWPPIFVTVDSVVFQSGHVLMVRRNAYPGKGLIALPGGFLDANSDSSLEDAMIRELREETGLKVPSPVLCGSIRNTHVFDSIHRSSRGRTITHAFNIVLSDGELPRVKGGSDADKAFWIPFSELDPRECFEDHYQIIRYFI